MTTAASESDAELITAGGYIAVNQSDWLKPVPSRLTTELGVAIALVIILPIAELALLMTATTAQSRYSARGSDRLTGRFLRGY